MHSLKTLPHSQSIKFQKNQVLPILDPKKAVAKVAERFLFKLKLKKQRQNDTSNNYKLNDLARMNHDLSHRKRLKYHKRFKSSESTFEGLKSSKFKHIFLQFPLTTVKQHKKTRIRHFWRSVVIAVQAVLEFQKLRIVKLLKLMPNRRKISNMSSSMIDSSKSPKKRLKSKEPSEFNNQLSFLNRVQNDAILQRKEYSRSPLVFRKTQFYKEFQQIDQRLTRIFTLEERCKSLPDSGKQLKPPEPMDKHVPEPTERQLPEAKTDRRPKTQLRNIRVRMQRQFRSYSKENFKIFLKPQLTARILQK